MAKGKTARYGAVIGAAGLVLSATLAVAPAAYAQAPASSPTFPDIPENHWAYEAVRTLADKGLIKGYPDGTFLGKRALTRYEFSMVMSRLLDTLHAAATPLAPNLPSPPAPPGVTQDDLNRVQALVEAFRGDLTALRADLKTANSDIAALRASVEEAQAKAQKALDTANAAAASANAANAAAGSAYGMGPGHKLTISGFVETRYERADSGNKTLFPDGVGTGNGYNGNYLAGTNGDTFKVRETRIAIGGPMTDNTRYIVELGTPGAFNTTVGGTPQVFVRRLYGQYTFGNGDPKKNLSLVAGQFWLPFGYMISSPRPHWYSLERPLAFNESAVGLFANQEFDRGVQLSYAPGAYNLKAAIINGSGATSNDINRPKDVVTHLTYTFSNVTVGASGYWGKINTTPNTSSGAKKELYGLDLQLQPYRPSGGPFLETEYMTGTYEAIPPATVGSATPPSGTTVPQASAYVPGNKIEGYYVTSGWTFHPLSAHPFSLIGSYDVFNRSKSQHTRTDRNLGYGTMYNLDRATRVRLYYIRPQAVAYAPGTVAPPKIGLYTAELLFRF